MKSACSRRSAPLWLKVRRDQARPPVSAVGRSADSSAAPSYQREIVDILGAAGMKSPDISILSDEFLAEIQGMEKKNLAAACASSER